MKITNNVLIIGSIPPPVGGVSIHTERLLDNLLKLQFPHEFINLKRFKLKELIMALYKHKIIHLHTSNPYLQFVLAIFSFFCVKKLVITFHGDLNRPENFHNFWVSSAIKICEIPILLNLSSYIVAKKYNIKSVLISSFIPPKVDLFEKSLPFSNLSIQKFEKIFSTYAYRLSFDKNRIEIYQIKTLFEIFNKMPQNLLIISDPSGEYKKFIQSKYFDIPENIKIIPYPHNFTELLLLSDCYIRFTSTDGDSLAVREALYLNKKVIASNNVDRPEGVELVEFDKNKLEEKIKTISLSFKNNGEDVDTIQKIFSIYEKLGAVKRKITSL